MDIVVGEVAFDVVVYILMQKFNSGVTYMLVKQTQHLSPSVEKQSLHFAVLSYEGFCIRTLLKSSVSSTVN